MRCMNCGDPIVVSYRDFCSDICEDRYIEELNNEDNCIHGYAPGEYCEICDIDYAVLGEGLE